MTNLNNIGKQSKKKIMSDENYSDTDSDIATNVTSENKINSSIISSKLSNNEVMKNINDTIQNIDETDSGNLKKKVLYQVLFIFQMLDYHNCYFSIF